MGKQGRRARAARYELRNQVISALRARGRSGGPWSQTDAAATVAVLIDVFEELLVAHVSSLACETVANWAADELAKNQDAQDVARSRTVNNPSHAHVTMHFTDRSTDAQVILEFAARYAPADGALIDQFTMDRLLILARQWWQLSVVGDRVGAGLSDITWLRVEARGNVSFTMTDHAGFAMTGFEQAYVERMAVEDRGGDDDVTVVSALVASLIEGTAIPEALVEVDSGLRASRGYGLIATLAALECANDIGNRFADSRAGYMIRGDSLAEMLFERAEGWGVHCDPTEAVRALPFLTFNQAMLRTTRPDYVNFRETQGRMLSRPILELANGKLLIARTAAWRTLQIYVQRIMEGNWPEELTPDDAPLVRALERRRNMIRPIDGFERDVETELQRSGVAHRSHVGPSAAGRPSEIGVVLSREIDAIAVNGAGNTIWVIEAKDLAFPFSARRIRSECDKYTRPQGHFEKLRIKCAEIAVAPSAVASSLGSDPADSMAVRGMFVTREPSPAAFIDQDEFQFVTIERLAAMLAAQ